MNDTLLERYLQAVGKYLPEATRNDTVKELRANLLERMDAREDELGRPMNEPEVAMFLREIGKPEAVALHYLPQRSLIGPQVFPFYEYTIRKTAPFVVLAYTAACAVEFAVTRGSHFRGALSSYAGGLITTLLTFLAVVTIVFAAIDFLRNRPDVHARLTTWDPMALPRLSRDATPATTRSFAKRVIDLCFHCLWFAYVLWFPAHPFWFFGPGVFYFSTLGLALAPVWHTFYAVLLVLLSVQLVIKVLAFVPHLAPKLKPAGLLSKLVGLALMGLLAHASVYFVAASPSADLQQLAQINEGLNMAFRVVVVVVALGLTKQLWRYVQTHRTGASQFAF